MEHLLPKINSLLQSQVYENYLRLYGFLNANYNVNVIYDDENELSFKCAGKHLCSLTIKDNNIVVLIIFGKAQRDVFDKTREKFSSFIQQYYDNSKTYHDGKWMFIKLTQEMYVGEIIELIKIKKKPNPKAMTMCGYKCDLCKAYTKNIKKNDERQKLSDVWHKYYDLDIPIDEIACDGCRSKKKDAKLIDEECPVRKCVVDRKIDGCFGCDKYPCDVYEERVGLCYASAKDKLADEFLNTEFEEYLLAFDNKTRIDRLKDF